MSFCLHIFLSTCLSVFLSSCLSVSMSFCPAVFLYNFTLSGIKWNWYFLGKTKNLYGWYNGMDCKPSERWWFYERIQRILTHSLSIRTGEHGDGEDVVRGGPGVRQLKQEWFISVRVDTCCLMNLSWLRNWFKKSFSALNELRSK